LARKASQAKTSKPAGKSSASKKQTPKRATPTKKSAGAGKIWIKSYPPGVPAEIDIAAIRPLNETLVAACEKFAPLPAFTCMGKALTYGDLNALSARFAAFLQARGLEKGDRVAVMMPNILQYPVAMLGVLRAGMTIVNVNPLYTARELEHQLNDSGATAIVVLENFAATVQNVIGRTGVKHVIVTSMGEMLGGLKGMIVNLVVRRVKKMVPQWNLPGHFTFSQALVSAGKAPNLLQLRMTIPRSCNIQAALPVFRKALRFCIQTWRQILSRTRYGSRSLSERSRAQNS